MLWDVAEIGSSTRVLEDDISYFIGSFQDENSIPSCKKYHSLADALKNLYGISSYIQILSSCEKYDQKLGFIAPLQVWKGKEKAI